LFSQIENSQKVGAMLMQCAITSDFYFLPFYVLAYSVYGGSNIYINRCIDAINRAKNKAEEHRPTTLIGKIFAVGEQIVKEIMDCADLGWETEYEKTWAAEKSMEQLMNDFEVLKSAADELKDKLVEASNNEYINFF
jgi:hypothetical protein